MVRKAIKIGGGLLALALVATGVGLAWSKTELVVDRSDPDPAIAYLNAQHGDDAPFREGYYEYAGNTLHYVEAGEGETILFLHGFPSYWFSLSKQMVALKGDYRVVAIDGLGAGRSDTPRDIDQYQLEMMTAHVMALMDELDSPKFHLVGHDWGATLAFGLAQRYPERILSVTGISAPPQSVLLRSLENDPQARAAAAYIERLKGANPLLILIMGGDKAVWTGAYKPLVEAGHLTQEEGQLFRDATGDPKRIHAHINWYRANIPSPDALSDRDYWPSAEARLTMPAQMVWGKDDRILVASYNKRLAEIADDLRSLNLPDTGHWPHVERAAEVTRAVREHIESASDR